MITIIGLIIIAGISLNLLLGDNGLISRAKTATKLTNLATIKEQLEMELVSIKIDNYSNNEILTSSEIIEKMKEDNIINDDLTFVSNPEYSISYNGSITDSSGEVVEDVDIQNSSTINELQLSTPSAATASTGTFTVKCVNGTIGCESGNSIN